MNSLITVVLLAAVASANNNDMDEMEAAYFCIAGKTYTIAIYNN